MSPDPAPIPLWRPLERHALAVGLPALLALAYAAWQLSLAGELRRSVEGWHPEVAGSSSDSD